jgi:hypothetical protein
MKYLKKLIINNTFTHYKDLFDIDIDSIYGLKVFVNNLKIEDYHDFYFMFKEKPLNERESNTLDLIRLASYKFLTETLNRNSDLEEILKDDLTRYIRYYGQVKDKLPDFIFDIEEEDILTYKKRVSPGIQYDYIVTVKGKHEDKYNEFIFLWNIELITTYLENFIKKPWKEYEDSILKNVSYTNRISNYLIFLKKYYLNQGISEDKFHDEIQNKHPNIIKFILEKASNSKDPYGINYLIYYIKDFSGKRWKKAEDIIFNDKNKDIDSYIDYAVAVKDPIPEIEYYVSKYDKGSLIKDYFKKVVSPRFNSWEEIQESGFEFVSNLRQECINNGTIIDFYRSLENFIHTKKSFTHSIYLEIYKNFPDVINYFNHLIDIEDAIRFVKKLLELNDEEEWNKYSNDIKKIFLIFVKDGNNLKNYGFKFLQVIREKLDAIFDDKNKIKEIILDTFPDVTKIIKDFTNEFNDYELERFTFDIIKGPWDVAEELILKYKLGTVGASYVQMMMNGKRWPEFEKVILDEGNSRDCYYYIIAVKTLIPEFEEIINRSRDYKIRYEKYKSRL